MPVLPNFSNAGKFFYERMINMWPTVLRKDDLGRERVYDLASCMLANRIILLTEPINDETAAAITSQLLYLEAENSNEPITIYINSPGGNISSGFAIYDVMNKIKCPVHTMVMGIAASMAAFILCSGSRGNRYALPNASIMIHQPKGAVEGQATEVEIYAKRLVDLRQELYKIMAKNTGMSYEEMAYACERDNYLTPTKALEMGFIDKIISFHPKAQLKEAA